MKREKSSAEKGWIELLVFPCAALLLLILAWIVGAKGPWRLILSLLSFLVSLYALREELIAALRSRDFRSGLLLLTAAGILCICTGKAGAAALAMLIRLIGALLLPKLRSGVVGLLDTRRELNPLKDQLPKVKNDSRLVLTFNKELVIICLLFDF